MNQNEQENQEKSDFSIKIVVSGTSGVGKSCILHRYSLNEFDDQILPTLGVNFFKTSKLINNHKILIHFWDTAGEERLKSNSQSYYKGSDGVILVYDISNQRSFDQLDIWREEIVNSTQKDCQIILLGNKTDLSEERQVTKQQGEEYAKQHSMFFQEVSAKQNENDEIQQGIQILIDQIFNTFDEIQIQDRKQDYQFRLNSQKNARMSIENPTPNQFSQISCCQQYYQIIYSKFSFQFKKLIFIFFLLIQLMIKLLYVFLTMNFIQTHCEQGYTMQIVNKEVKCMPCPENCESCFTDVTKQIKCFFCKNGYFLENNQQKCSQCTENCKSCIGDSLDQCTQSNPGFFFQESSNSFKKCNDEGCAHCDQQNKCYSCKNNFFREKIENQDEKTDEVKCINCNLENCKICVKNSEAGQDFTKCRFCESGYGLINGMCQKCPDNCDSCSEQPGKCMICKKGYITKDDGTCELSPVKHCFALDKDQQCKHCESKFYLENNQCIPCENKQENCSFCRMKENEFICLKCKTGFLDKEDSCQACSENCNQCDTNGCFLCKEGFYVNETTKKCEECSIENCINCNSNEICQECIPGYFFNSESKKCELCNTVNENCLKCSLDGKRCLSCPLKYFTLEESIVTQSNSSDGSMMLPTLLSGLFGNLFKELKDVKITEIHMEKKCVKKCPETLHDKKVIIDYSRRQCLVENEDSPFSFLNPNHDNKPTDVLDQISEITSKYQEEIDSSKAKAIIEDDGKSELSEECFFRGKLIKEITGHAESYYFCRCKEDFLGDNCQINKSIFDEAQKEVVKVIQRLDKEFVNHDKHQQKILLKSMIQVQKIKLSKGIIIKLFTLLKQTLELNKEMDNQEELYLVFDSLILSLYDILEDQRKNSTQYDRYEVDYVKDRQNTYNYVMQIIKLLEYSFEDLQYAESFLSKDQEKYVSLNTYAFTMSEFQIKDLDSSSLFELRNPVIDTAQQLTSPTTLHYKFLNGFKNEFSPYNVQIINFSTVLFENEFDQQSDVSVSNMIYIRNINPQKPHNKVENHDIQIQRLVIRFPLLFLPPPEMLTNSLQCKAYSFQEHKSNKYGTMINLNQDSEEVLCEFEGDFEYNGYYFGVFYSK